MVPWGYHQGTQGGEEYIFKDLTENLLITSEYVAPVRIAAKSVNK